MVPGLLLVPLLAGKMLLLDDEKPLLDVEIPMVVGELPLLDVEISMVVGELPLLVGDVLMPGPQEMDEAPLCWSNIYIGRHAKLNYIQTVA